MRTFEKLEERLSVILGEKPNNFRRTYAGKNMKAVGAFVWEADIGTDVIGSRWTASSLLRCENIVCERTGRCEIEVFPD